MKATGSHAKDDKNYGDSEVVEVKSETAKVEQKSTKEKHGKFPQKRELSSLRQQHIFISKLN